MTQRSRGRSRRLTRKIAPVMAQAWYRPEQWDRLRAISADGDRIEARYEQWLEGAQQVVEQLQLEGVVVERIEVDVEELLAWCQTNGLTLDASARANYAADQLRRRYEPGEPAQEDEVP